MNSKANIFRDAFILLIFGVLGCQPMLGVLHNVNQPITVTRQLRMDEVRHGVLTALTRKSWRLVQETPGRIRANINVAGHEATVDVVYSQTQYAIQHVSSSAGLKFEDEGDRQVIHRRYNNWIVQLDKAIYSELSTMAMATPSIDPPAVQTPPPSVP